MISFSINREPYLPNPAMGQACMAKEQILDFGGRFCRFTINGYSTLQALEKHLIADHGLNRVIVEDAIGRMLITAHELIDGTVMENLLIDENINGVRYDTFAGFAFTDAELEMKTQLFLKGIQQMKSCLEDFTRDAGIDSTSVAAAWTL